MMHHLVDRAALAAHKRLAGVLPAQQFAPLRVEDDEYVPPPPRGGWPRGGTITLTARILRLLQRERRALTLQEMGAALEHPYAGVQAGCYRLIKRKLVRALGENRPHQYEIAAEVWDA